MCLFLVSKHQCTISHSRWSQYDCIIVAPVCHGEGHHLLVHIEIWCHVVFFINSWICSTIIMHRKLSKIRYLPPLRPCPNVTGGRGQKSPTALLKTVLVFLFLFLESWLNQAAIAWLRPETTFVSFLLRYYCSVVPSLVLHPRRIDTHFIHIHNISPIFPRHHHSN